MGFRRWILSKWSKDVDVRQGWVDKPSLKVKLFVLIWEPGDKNNILLYAGRSIERGKQAEQSLRGRIGTVHAEEDRAQLAFRWSADDVRIHSHIASCPWVLPAALTHFQLRLASLHPFLHAACRSSISISQTVGPTGRNCTVLSSSAPAQTPGAERGENRYGICLGVIVL